MKEIYSPYAEKIKKQEKTESWTKLKKIGSTVVGIVVLGAGVYGIASSQNGGTDLKANPDTLGTGDNTIETVVLKPDANIRYDHTTGGQYDNNLIESVEKKTNIEIGANPVYVHDEGELGNGKWYGIPAEDLEKAGVDTSADKDGIAWVNEQGIDSIEHTAK
ncbi:MAG: hypothetical protein WA087_03150 [Candidatus Saccharimonadales bacterium]